MIGGVDSGENYADEGKHSPFEKFQQSGKKGNRTKGSNVVKYL